MFSKRIQFSKDGSTKVFFELISGICRVVVTVLMKLADFFGIRSLLGDVILM